MNYTLEVTIAICENFIKMFKAAERNGADKKYLLELEALIMTYQHHIRSLI
jgi:hypothetical protein